jgi:hypothetical protein
MTVLTDPAEAGQTGTAQNAVLPFYVWLRAWMPHHRIAAGAVAGVISVVTALALLTVFGFSATPNVPPPVPVNRLAQIITQNATQETTALIRRDWWDDVVSRGEMLGGEPFAAEQLAGISVTVEGPNATCRLLIDGKLVDEAAVPAEGGQATCMWVLPSR